MPINLWVLSNYFLNIVFAVASFRLYPRTHEYPGRCTEHSVAYFRTRPTHVHVQLQPLIIERRYVDKVLCKYHSFSFHNIRLLQFLVMRSYLDLRCCICLSSIFR